MLKYIIGALLGGAVGYVILYKLIGCSSGSCRITANPYISTIYGMVLGIILAGTIISSTTPKEDTTKGSTIEYKTITSVEAHSRINSGDTIIILDVRTEEEYNAEHIPEAILIPNETISDKMPELLPDLEAEILIYCRSGNRSAQAAKKLSAIGYTNIYDFGGIIDWPYDKVSD